MQRRFRHSQWAFPSARKWRSVSLRVQPGGLVSVMYRRNPSSPAATEKPLFAASDAVDVCCIPVACVVLTLPAGLQLHALLQHQRGAPPPAVPAPPAAEPPDTSVQLYTVELRILPGAAAGTSGAASDAILSEPLRAAAEDCLRFARAMKDAGAAVNGLDSAVHDDNAGQLASATVTAADAAVAHAAAAGQLALAAVGGAASLAPSGAVANVAAGILVVLEGAPFGIGVIARALLLIKDTVDAVVALEGEAHELRSLVWSCTMSLGDVYDLTDGCKPVASLEAWLKRLEEALTAATYTLDGLLGGWMSVERDTWLEWLKRTAKAAVFSSDIRKLASDLRAAWGDVGPVLTVQARAQAAAQLKAEADRVIDAVPSATAAKLQPIIDQLACRLEAAILSASQEGVAAADTTNVLLHEVVTKVNEFVRASHRDAATLPPVSAIPSINVAAYATAVVARYGKVQGLDQLSTDGASYDDVKLLDVFVPQNVRPLTQHPKILDLPRDALRQLSDRGGRDRWQDVLSDEALDAARRYVQQQPVPLLQELDKHPRVVLLGDPGAGKTSLIRHQLLLWAGADSTTRASLPLPFVVELGKFSHSAEYQSRTYDFVSYIARGGALNMPLDPAAVRGALSGPVDGTTNGTSAIVFFDALDEVSDDAARSAIADAIASLASAYPAARVIVTSRIIGYNRAPFHDSTPPFAERILLDLDDAQINGVLQRWHSVTWATADDERRTAKLLSIQRAVASSRAIRELAGNPLLLTMMAILNRTLPELPRNRHELYVECAKMLLGRWHVDVELAKIAPLAQYADHFGPPFKMTLLRRLARDMLNDRTTLGNIVDKTHVISTFSAVIQEEKGHSAGVSDNIAAAIIGMLHERNFILAFVGGRSYAFLHRTFLEFFCAADIKHCFETKQTLTRDELRTVFVKRCTEPSWREVLGLLTSMLDPAFVGPCLRAMAPRNVSLTFRCIDEVANARMFSLPVAADDPASPDAQESERTEVVAMLHSPSVDDDRNQLIIPLAPLVLSALWANHPRTLSILTSTAHVQGHGRWAAAMALARDWTRDSNTPVTLAGVARACDGLASSSAIDALGRWWPLHDVTFPALQAVALSGTPIAAVAVRELAHSLAQHDLVYALLCRIAIAGRWASPEPVASVPTSGGQSVISQAMSAAEVAVEVLAAKWGDDSRTFDVLCEVAASATSGAEMAVRQLATRWREHPKVLRVLIRVVSSRSFGAVEAINALASCWRQDDNVFECIVSASRSGVAVIADAAVDALVSHWGTTVDVCAVLEHIATSGKPGADAAISALLSQQPQSERIHALVRAVAESGAIGAAIAMSSLIDGPRRADDVRRIVTDVANSERPAAGAAVRLMPSVIPKAALVAELVSVIDGGHDSAAVAIGVLHNLHLPHLDDHFHLLVRVARTGPPLAAVAAVQSLVAGWNRNMEAHEAVVAAAKRGDVGVSDEAAEVLGSAYADQPTSLPFLLRIAEAGRPGSHGALKAIASKSVWRAQPGTLQLFQKVAVSDAIGADVAVQVLAAAWGGDEKTLTLLHQVARTDRVGAPSAVLEIASRWRDHRDTLKMLSIVSRSDKRGSAEAKSVLKAWRDEI